MDLTRLGKYEIVSKIGQGAMGEVFRAQDPVLGREVAIKTMAATIGANEELRIRFHREAQSAARLNHPNIITVFDFGEEQGHVYMAMELLDGFDLKDLISRREPLRLEEKLGLMEQMAEGLAFAHSKDVIHRDLKPANIHIHGGVQVKIMDFGLARLSTSDMTRAGTIMGTPHYMSPEQVRGERATAQSDVFSLGSVFYELLTYRKPFEADSIHAVLFQVLQQEPQPLDVLTPDVPAVVREVVQRAMAKDLGRRYKTGGELRQALREVRTALGRAEATRGPAATVPAALASRGATALDPTRLVAEPATARPPAQPETVSGRSSTAVPAPAPRRAPSRPSGDQSVVRRSPWLLPTGVGALVAVAGTAGYFVFGPAPSPVPSPSGIPAPTTLSARLEASAGPPPVDAARIEEGRRALEGKDYRAAAAAAEAALAQDANHTGAQRLLGEAKAGVRQGELLARDVRTSLERSDADGASAALARLLQTDPRHPEIQSLTLRLNEALQAKAQRAQKALEQARTQPPPPSLAPSHAPPATVPAATLPAAPPSVAPQLPAVQSEAAARQAIRGVLEEYRTAFESLNLDAMRAVYPGVDAAAMRQAFSTVTAYNVKIQVQAIGLTGDTATVSCLVTYNPVPKPAGKMPPVPTVFHLKRTGEVWIVDRLARK